MNHTPTPWRIGDAGKTIFGPPNGNPSPETVAHTTKANAAFIVRAVNNFEMLTNQLANCKAYLKMNFPNDSTAQLLVKAAEQAIAKAEAI